jgi:gluconolactonase
MPDGSLQFKSKLLDFGKNCPDGMTIDVDGNLYIGLGDNVGVFAPDGKKITEIKSPRATNVCFGRAQFSKTLFIAGGKSIYSIETKRKDITFPLRN